VELTPGPGTLAGVALLLSDHASLLAELDGRERAHAAEAGERLAALTATAAVIQGTLADQAAILAGLPDLSRRISELAARLDGIHPAGTRDGEQAYRPEPGARSWADGDARDQAVTRLRALVADIYRPGYGHLAAGLGDCWDQHPFCLYTLDWLSELWSVLYLEPCRDAAALAGQAEWQTRLLPAAAGQMAAETSRCPHATRPALPSRLAGQPPRPARPPAPTDAAR
jgi:hypothetical protein